MAIFMSLLNFIIFFFSTRNLKRYTPHEVHRDGRSLRQTCEDRRDMRAVRSTSVLSAAGRSLTIRRWNSVSAPSARAITNTVRIICLHISIFG